MSLSQPSDEPTQASKYSGEIKDLLLDQMANQLETMFMSMMLLMLMCS